MERTKFTNKPHSATEQVHPALLKGVNYEENEDTKNYSDTTEYNYDEITEGLLTEEKAVILGIQAEIQTRLTNIKKDTYKIGELLCKAKQKLPHGKFKPWINMFFKDELPYGTAYLYMRIYSVFEGRPQMVQVIPMKCLVNFTQKDFPAEVFRLIEEYSDRLNPQSLQCINSAYGLMKSGTLSNDKLLQIVKDELKDALDSEAGRNKHRVNRNMRQPLYYGIEELVKHINEWRVAAEKMGWLYPCDPSSKELLKANSLLDQAIDELRELKSAINGGQGLFKAISTPEGDKLN